MDTSLASLLFNFHGRINRAKYWIAGVIYIAMMIVLVGLAFVSDFSTAFFVIAAAIVIAMFVSGVAVGNKRLHDRDKSGRWLLLFFLVPGLLDGLGRGAGFPLIFDLASFAISIFALVELGFRRGTSGPNQYGPDPLAAQ